MKKFIFLFFISSLTYANFDKTLSQALTSKKEVLSYFGCDKSNEIKCKMINRHLTRDSKKCYVDPGRIEDLLPLFHQKTVLKQVEIKGHNFYLGFFPAKYHYLALPDASALKISSSVHYEKLSEFSASEINNLDYKLGRAGFLWSYYNPYSYPLKFSLERQQNKKNAFYKNLNLKRTDTRGPYFANWSLLWDNNTFMHEFGHILGLDDEYRNHPFGGSNASCDRDSAMCSSRLGKPQEYHYYLILRRLMCL